MAGSTGELKETFVMGSSKPKVEESIESRIKNEILKKQKDSLNANSNDNIELFNIVINMAEKRDNPDSNYYYKGTASIRIYEHSTGQSKREFQEFGRCDISGDAQIDDNNVGLVNGISIDSSFTKHIKLFFSSNNK